MKIELNKSEAIFILSAIHDVAIVDNINYTNNPVKSNRIYGIMKKYQRYVLPNIRSKIDKNLVKTIIDLVLKTTGMINYGKTKKRKSTN